MCFLHQGLQSLIKHKSSERDGQGEGGSRVEFDSCIADIYTEKSQDRPHHQPRSRTELATVAAVVVLYLRPRLVFFFFLFALRIHDGERPFFCACGACGASSSKCVLGATFLMSVLEMYKVPREKVPTPWMRRPREPSPTPSRPWRLPRRFLSSSVCEMAPFLALGATYEPDFRACSRENRAVVVRS